VIEAGGLVLCPGLVDLAARLREPGFEYKATLESEMRAAVAGGVTTLACPPDTDPPLDEPGLVEMLTRRAASLHQARVHPLGALTVGLKGEKLAEMLELAEAGCVGFFQANAPIRDLSVLLQAMRYASTVRLHRLAASAGCRPREGRSSRTKARSPRAWAWRRSPRSPRPSRCARSSSSRLPRGRACTSPASPARRAWRWSRRRRRRRADHVRLSARTTCTCATATSATSTRRRISSRRCATLRTADALRRALADGTIDAVCSDHTPVDDDEKLVPFARPRRAPRGWSSCCRSR
jgi:dihydroorotase